MAKKVIAGFLLVAMAAWAELALAPMLAMHAGHVHPSHAKPAETALHENHYSAAAQRSSAPHSCCPGLQQPKAEGLLELVADVSGCQDGHNCCFRQGPQSVPAPVSEGRQLARHLAPATATESTQTASDLRIFAAVPIGSPPLPHVFGMTLRV